MSPLDVDSSPMAEITDTMVEGHRSSIPVRIYRPHGAGPNWIVYLHGGGGVIGSIRSSEPVGAPARRADRLHPRLRRLPARAGAPAPRRR